MARIVVDDERCKGCGLCVHYCPPKVVSLAEQTNTRGYRPARLTNPDGCTGCAICGRVCPDVAIDVYR